MEKIKNFLLLQQGSTTALTDFVINAIICIGLSSIIAYLYTKYGFSLSNKVRFA